MKKIKQNVLAGQVKREIEEMILNGELSPGDKLESELVLAEQLGVSRVTLREALKVMENDGLIERKNGVGTFVAIPNPFISGRLEIDFSLTDAAGAAGIDLTTHNMDCVLRLPSKREREKLLLEEHEEVICFKRKRYMGNDCIALSFDVLPATSIPKERIHELKNKSLYLFLEHECNCNIENGDAELSATIATEFYADEMGLHMGDPLLLVEQVDYETKNKPLLFSREYYNSRQFKFKIKRQRSMEQYALEYLHKV